MDGITANVSLLQFLSLFSFIHGTLKIIQKQVCGIGSGVCPVDQLDPLQKGKSGSAW